MGTGCGLE